VLPPADGVCERGFLVPARSDFLRSQLLGQRGWVVGKRSEPIGKGDESNRASPGLDIVGVLDRWPDPVGAVVAPTEMGAVDLSASLEHVDAIVYVREVGPVSIMMANSFGEQQPAGSHQSWVGDVVHCD